MNKVVFYVSQQVLFGQVACKYCFDTKFKGYKALKKHFKFECRVKKCNKKNCNCFYCDTVLEILEGSQLKTKAVFQLINKLEYISDVLTKYLRENRVSSDDSTNIYEFLIFLIDYRLFCLQRLRQLMRSRIQYVTEQM